LNWRTRPMAFKRSTLRYGETPEPVTPYQKAAQVWDERIGSARVQAQGRPRDRCGRGDQRGARLGQLLPGALAGTDLRGRSAQKHQAPHRPLLHRDHAAADGGSGAQEPARHLRARLQLVAGRDLRRAEMTAFRTIALLATLLLVLAACATRV